MAAHEALCSLFRCLAQRVLLCWVGECCEVGVWVHVEAVVISREVEKGRSCDSRARFLTAHRGPWRASLWVILISCRITYKYSLYLWHTYVGLWSPPPAFNLWVGMGCHLFFTLPCILLYCHVPWSEKGRIHAPRCCNGCLHRSCPTLECEATHRSVISIPAPLSSLHAVAHASGLCAPPFFICLGWCFSSQIMLSWLRSSHKSDLLALGLFSGLLPTPWRWTAGKQEQPYGIFFFFSNISW